MNIGIFVSDIYQQPLSMALFTMLLPGKGPDVISYIANCLEVHK